MSLVSDRLAQSNERIYAFFGDAAHFTARDCAAVAVTVLLDHDLSQYGETARVATKTVVVGVRIAQVSQPPRKGDVFDITTGKFAGRSLRVDSVVSSDEFEHKVLAA